jgi:hypothetical protein
VFYTLSCKLTATLGDWLIITPMRYPIDCSNDSSSSLKSFRSDTIFFRLVFGIKIQSPSFLSSMVYCQIFPFVFPIQPSLILASCTDIGKVFSLHRCCNHFDMPHASTSCNLVVFLTLYFFVIFPFLFLFKTIINK